MKLGYTGKCLFIYKFNLPFLSLLTNHLVSHLFVTPWTWGYNFSDLGNAFLSLSLSFLSLQQPLFLFAAKKKKKTKAALLSIQILQKKEKETNAVAMPWGRKTSFFQGGGEASSRKTRSAIQESNEFKTQKVPGRIGVQRSLSG
jgi:hypothetical protein